MNTKDYMKLMQNILHYIEDGIHVIDNEGNTVVYNKAMAELEQMKETDVLNKNLLDIFNGLDEETSTLLKVLKSGIVIKDKKQTYLNKYKNEITTVNTTMPITENGKTLGAIEISKDITKMKELSDEILTLHREKSNPKNNSE